MSSQKTLLTADEFYRLYGHKDGRYELVDGEVVEMVPPNWEHGGVALNIGSAMLIFVRRNSLGAVRVESGYRISTGPDTVRGPDVSFVAASRVPADVSDISSFPGAPDIAVEVVSPSNTATDVARKVAEYLAAGSQRVWVVYSATRTASRRVIIHHADSKVITYAGDDVIADEELLPGFSLPLAEIFE